MPPRSVGSQLRVHAGSGSEPGACVTAHLPSGRPPSVHHLRRRLEVGVVRGFTGVGSEEARSIALALASVRRSNWTCSFPASSFHEWALAIRREGISETRLTNILSTREWTFCF